MGSIYSERIISDWGKFKSTLPSLLDAWVFRGQKDSDWEILSSIERLSNPDDRDARELIALEVFKKKIHHHLKDEPLPERTLEWLSLMQHHGVPTRLTDWSRSPYVASFFALEEFAPSVKSSAVWAINIGWLYAMAINKVRTISSDYSDLDVHDELSGSRFDDVLMGNHKKFVVSLHPASMNMRLSVQQGLFLAPGSVNDSFMENLQALPNAEIKKNVFKFIIPRSQRQEALDDLYRMNISHASLFPGIDGFASSVRTNLSLYELNADTLNNIRLKKETAFNRFY